jgi:uncharacterized protein YodC (DUF2158 family)
MMPTIRRSALAALLAVLVLPAGAHAANTITVNPGDDVQAKVDSAADGDTVHFKAGSYSATVSTAKNNLTIEGEAGVILANPASATTPTLTFTGSGAKLTDMTIVSTVADAVVLGKDTTLVQRSELVTLKSGASALSVTGGVGDAARTITIDSSVLVGPKSFSASYGAATIAGAGITVAARHLTAIGNVVADASQGSLAAGNIAETFLDSVIRGARAAVAGTPTTATITAAADRNSVADTAADVAALFVRPGGFNYHLRADASSLINKGQLTTGESDKDIDGDPRVGGAASDYGADEFVNRAPTAALSGPTAKVRQGIAATFDASKSTDPEGAVGGGIANYHWEFGDGSSADTTTPTTTHAFSERKSYDITVTVTDKQGASSAASSPVSIEVIDGTPPTVSISQPRVKQRINLYKKKSRRRAAVTFFGKSTDDTLLSKVYLALRPLKLAGTQCRWFDGKRKLVTAGCGNPAPLSATLTGTSWRYTLPLKAKLPKGAYQLVAIAYDASGLPSAVQTVNFRFR